jgi:phage terminase large subunit
MPPTAQQSIDLWRGYMPFPTQEAFHRSEAPWRLLAGGFGGGKTKPACREAIHTALAYPRSLGIIGRRQYRPLIDSTWRTFIRELRETGLYDKRYVTITGGNSPSSPPYVKFADSLGGSEIMFRNADNEENFYGVEPDWVFLDEGAEIADNIYEVIGGRLRGTPNPTGKVENERGVKVSGPLRAWVATNPGASRFLRTNFRVPGLENRSTPGFDTFAVPTLENPTLPDSYIAFLQSQYTGARYEAFVRGDWSAFEGQVFTNFDAAQHIIDNIDGPALAGKLIIEGWDFGRAVETAVVWLAVDPEGREPIICFADYGAAEVEVPDHARKVKAIRAHFGLTDVVAFGDPAGRQRAGGGDYFSLYADEGVFIAPCDIGKRQGVRDERVGALLGHRIHLGSEGFVPGLVFCKRTERGVVQALISAQYKPESSPDKNRPDERLKKDDHRLDALEYGLMGCPPPQSNPGPSSNELYGHPRPDNLHLFDRAAHSGWVEVG